MEDERLDRQASRLGVDPADERPDGAPGEPLDRFAELPHGRVLKERSRIAQALVLAEHGEAALGGVKRVLQDGRQDVVAAPILGREPRQARITAVS
jgi:hypothetical protein